MIKVDVQTGFEENQLRTVVGAASRKSMYKASAFAMKMARQKIRYRSYKVSSRPGSPPYKHGRGNRSFSHSIRFFVDGAGTTAVIGPQKEGSKVNPSGPIPKTLEFGGKTSRRPNTMWFSRRNVPWGAKSRGEITAWVLKQKYGPLYMSNRLSALRNKLGNRTLNMRRAPDLSGARGSYKVVHYLTARITTVRQANKAAENIIRHFGYPSVAASTIAPRPFMGPTLRENQTKILSFWQSII